MFADEFLTDKALASVAPGSVILVATWTFEMGETIPTEPAYFASRILSSPRMWPLLNASQPLHKAYGGSHNGIQSERVQVKTARGPGRCREPKWAHISKYSRPHRAIPHRAMGVGSSNHIVL